MGLYDALLIKENHVASPAGSPRRSVAPAPPRRTARSRSSAATPAEVAEALEAGADRLLLDNMDPERAARRGRRARRGGGGGRHGALLEASGGVTLEKVRRDRRAGVEFVSVGALTHSAPALDLSMLVAVGG